MIFKYLVCKCGYKKSDPTGKASAICKNCNIKMAHTDNWHVRHTIKGRTMVKSISPRKRDAEDYLATCKVAIRTGNLLPGEEKDISWEDAVKNCKKWWGDAAIRKEIKASTETYYKELLPVITPHFESKSLLTITKSDIIKYQTKMIADKKSPNTVNHAVKAIKRMYNMHVAHTSAEESPKLCAKAQDIGRVALVQKTGKKARFLSLDEIKIFLANATPMVKMAALISLNTGLRFSNVIELNWSEVKLSKKLITIPAAQMKSGREHSVDIPTHLVPILKEWRSGNKLSKALFTTARSFRTEWEKTTVACGFTDVTFHTLRHTFASQWLMNGGDLHTLSRILDHSSIQITMDTYSHLSRDYKTKATAQFADAFLSHF